jgi:ATP-dependent DNA helicase RecG
MEAKLNERQHAILTHMQEKGFVTNKWVQDSLQVVRDTAYRDIQELVDLKIIESKGKGRSTRYVLVRNND